MAGIAAAIVADAGSVPLAWLRRLPVVVKTTDLAKVRATLWGAADELRANSKLTPVQYRDPVLGLVFLLYAENRFEAVRGEVEAKVTARNPATIADYKAKSVLYVPDESRLSYLVALPEGDDIGKAVDKAINAIEITNPELKDILPHAYQKLERSTLTAVLAVTPVEMRAASTVVASAALLESRSDLASTIQPRSPRAGADPLPLLVEIERPRLEDRAALVELAGQRDAGVVAVAARAGVKEAQHLLSGATAGAELAHRLGVADGSRVTAWEHGRATPHPATWIVE